MYASSVQINFIFESNLRIELHPGREVYKNTIIPQQFQEVRLIVNVSERISDIEHYLGCFVFLMNC